MADHEEAAKRGILLSAGALGVLLALAPLTAASAKSTKGSAPHSAMCKTVKSEQSGSSAATGAIEKAMAGRELRRRQAGAPQGLQHGSGPGAEGAGGLKSAPPNVQAAFKDLLSYVKQFRTAIQNANSLTGLISAFGSLGKNPKLQTDSTTIANWYAASAGDRWSRRRR